MNRLLEIGFQTAGHWQLVDGELFFVQFLGPEGKVTIRWIDPLEITEIVTDPDDVENVLFYVRQWADAQGVSHTTVYRSAGNMANKATVDASNKSVSATDDGIVSRRRGQR